MRRSSARSLSKPTGRKSWWFSSIFNHYVLNVLAAVTTAVILTFRGCGTAASPEPRPADAARPPSEIAILSARLQEQQQRIAKLEQARREPQRHEPEPGFDEYRQERARDRQVNDAEREQRHRDPMRGDSGTSCETLEGERLRQPGRQAAKHSEGQGQTPRFDPVKVVAAARSQNAAIEELKASFALESANQMLTSEGGSVRRARWAWHSVIEQFPETAAARQAAKSLADTRDLLNAENEKDAADALKSANSAFHSGAAALARLRYRNIIADFPTTQAAREAQKKYSLLR